MLMLAVLLPMISMAQTYESVPYFQNFEGLSTGSQPAGWQAVQTGMNGSNTFPCAYGHAPNARNSSVYYEFEFSSSSSVRTEIAATCEFANVSNLMIDFYLATQTSWCPDLFEVGVMEDTTFVPVDTISVTAYSSGWNYVNYRVYFVDYSGYGTRIAFRATKNSGQMTLFMEDVTVANAPSCAYLPGTPSVSNLDSTSATLTWADASNTAGYFLYLTNDDSWYNSSYNSYTFTGLNPNTLYSGYLYNTCSGADTSEAVPFSFRTACGMPSFPLYEDFDSYGTDFPSCWYKSEPRNSYPSVTTSARHNAGYGISMYSTSAHVSIASPYLYAPINSLDTRFWAKKSSSSYTTDLAVGYVPDVNQMDSVVMVDTIHLTTDWTEYIVSFANTDMYESGHIVYRKIAGGSGNLYIDEITIMEAQTCPFPRDLSITGTAANQMNLAWDGNGASAWQVAYGPTGMNVDTVASNIQSFYTDTVTVTGLEDSITYDFYVRGDCGGDYSYWIGPVTARPNLIVMRANQRDTIRTCGGTIVDDGGLLGNFATNQSSRLYIYPSEPGKTVNLTGTVSTQGTYTYSTNTLTIYEGIGSGGRVLGTYANSNNATVNVSSTIGPITLKFETSYYAGPGFELSVSCSDLANCIDPYNVEVSDVAGASALVSWEYADATPAESFTITVTDTASGTSNAYTVADSIRNYMLSGLDQATVYHVTVEANCSASDISNPVGTYFMTTCFVGGSVKVGTATTGLDHIIYGTSNYSTVQMIYAADELTQVSDTIYGITLVQMSGASTSRLIDVYIDTTSRTTFTTANNFIQMDSSRMYFSGSINVAPGEVRFNFDRPFIRPDRTTNLLITIDNNSGSIASQIMIEGDPNKAGKTLYSYNGTNIDPLASGNSLSITSYRANMIFNSPCGDASCIAPAVTVGSVTANSVELNWVPGMNETSWTVEYKMASESEWTTAVASTSTQTTTITGLFANTQYNFRVGSICVTGDDVPYTYVNARTACATMDRSSLPLTENFDSYATGDMPNCWERTLTGTSGSGTFPSCYNYSYNAHSGNVYFEMESSSGSTEVFALPAIDSINGLAVEFWIGTSSSYCTTFEMGVLESDNRFTVLDTIDISNCTGLTSYVKKNARINYYGTGERIAFRATKSSGQMTVFLDDFRVYIPNPCDSVRAITADSITTTSIDISWTDTNLVGSYTVKVATSNDASTAFFTATTSNTFYTVTGLTPATTYYIFVYANCPSGLSDDNYIKATTGCDVITAFPFTQDFENFTANSSMGSATQACWNRGTNYTYTNYPYRYSYYNHTPGGGNSMYFYASGSYYSWLALPEMDNLDTLLLSFHMLGTSPSYYTYTATVGVMSDQNDISTFVPINTCTYSLNGSDWQKFKLPLSAAPDSCHFIAIKAESSSYMTFYIDDISVNYNNGCGDPTNFTVPMVGMSSATVAWTDTSNLGSYIVKLGTTNNVSDAILTDTVSTPTYTFNGLTGLTNYHVWIYNNCTTGLSDVLTGEFTTLGADPHFLPYTNDFEDPTNTFAVYQRSGSNTWYTGSAVNHGGSNCLYVTNDGGTTNAYTNTNQSISFAVTYLQIPYDSSYMISYDWRCQGEGTYDLMRVALAPEDYDFNNAFTAINRYSNTLPTGWIALDGGKRNLRNTWQYDENTVQLPAGNYYLTLVWINDGAMGSNPAAAIDNIHMELVTCPAPENLVASATSATTIDVDWDNGAASSWIVEYGAAGFTAGMGTTRLTTTSNITLTGLAPTTSYDIYVRPICSDSDTGYAAHVTCLTGCNEVITEFPWIEDFENGIDCWNQYYQRGTVAWTVGQGGNAYGGLAGAATGQYNARFTCNSYNGYTTYLITPQLSIQSDEDVMMTFYHAQPAWGTDQDTLAVLYRVSPDSAWHYLASWHNSITSWQSDTVMLPNTSSTYQVAFMAHSGFGLGILLDSIVVYGSETCPRPAFTNHNVGSTSITTTWNSPASNFEVAIRRVGQAWPEPTPTTNHTFTFTNLEPTTSYEYRVRSLCSDTSLSFWATTNCVTDTLECYVVEGLQVVDVDFESVTLSWNADVSGHAVAYVVNISNSAFNSTDTVYSNNVTLHNLYSDMTYGVTVQSMCSATTYSDWCESVNFTTATCVPVSNVTVSDITVNSAVIDWTPNGEEDTWIISYGFHDFNEGSGNTVRVNSHPYTINGLTDEMTYDVYVRPACTEDVMGAWSDVAVFTTLQAVGIQDVIDGNFICTIYPNPTTASTTISVKGVNGEVQISVVDINGRTLQQETLLCDGDCVKQMNVTDLAQGTYFVRITSHETSHVRKLIVR